MGMSYGIQGIGANYASDPYFMQTLSSPNYYAMMQAQNVAQQQAAQTTQAAQTATTPAVTADPSFKGAEQTAESGSGLGTGLLVGGTVVAGAAACIAAYKKRDGGSLLNGFKNLGKSLFGSKEATAAGEKAKSFVSNLIKDGGKNVKEYTIQKNGMSFVMKDGKPVKIITQDKKVIDKAKDVAKWVKDNSSVMNEVKKLNLHGTTLPKGVSLSYTREIADGKNLYRMVVENGQVVKASSKDKAGKWVEVAENQFDGFIKNHAKQVKEAETLTRTFGSKKVQLLNSKGKLVAQNGSIQMNVRNGKIVSAKFNGSRDLKPEELKALNQDYKSIVQNFGRENGSKYGLKNYEYIYRQKGGQEIRFNSAKSILRVNAVTNKEITNADAIRSYLEKNDAIKTELENIASIGTVSNGYRLGNIIYKNDNGITFNITGNKINGIKLGKKITIDKKTFKAGELIDGKWLDEWRKTAANDNDYQAVLAMLK